MNEDTEKAPNPPSKKDKGQCMAVERYQQQQVWRRVEFYDDFGAGRNRFQRILIQHHNGAKHE